MGAVERKALINDGRVKYYFEVWEAVGFFHAFIAFQGYVKRSGFFKLIGLAEKPKIIEESLGKINNVTTLAGGGWEIKGGGG